MTTPALISLEQARAHLRIDEGDSSGGADDAWLEDAILEVSDSVALWLGDSWRLYLWTIDAEGATVLDSQGEPVVELDSQGEPTVRRVVQRAVKMELENYNRWRGGEGDADVPAEHGHGYVLTKGATGVLAGLRRPVVG